MLEAWLCGKRNFKRRRRQVPLTFFYQCCGCGQVGTVVLEHVNAVCLCVVKLTRAIVSSSRMRCGCFEVVVASGRSATTTSSISKAVFFSDVSNFHLEQVIISS